MSADALTSSELEELLSRPCHGARAALARLAGPLVVLGAGGKLGPSLARMAARAGADVVAVSRFGGGAARAELEAAGVRTLAVDLVDARAVDGLPDAGALLFLAGTKFGTGADPATTWALNAGVPWNVARRYAGTPTVVFSSGNVYPLVPVDGPGASEDTPPAPLGEYAWSVLARERLFEHASRAHGTPVLLYRLNYAVELRYGVAVDVALRVRDGAPIDLTTGHVNLIWQGDANRAALRCVELCASPARALNVTGTERVSVRALAQRFGELLGRAPVFTGAEAPRALLSDARAARALCGPPAVDLEQLTRWIAAWLAADGALLGKPTRYEARDGAF
jgi:nucleoside-diphosphate-sugar epimerase